MRRLLPTIFLVFERFSAAFLMLFLGSFLAAAAQSPYPSPQDLVRRAVANELKPDEAKFMFQSRKQTPHGSQTRLYVQTEDATAGMLIAVNDQPLDPQQRQAEEGHLDYLVRNPAELKRKRKQEKEDSDRITRILRAMPDAFVFEEDGREQGRSGVGTPGELLVRLKFRPNPQYDPPSRVEQVLTGMKGYILVDAGKHRIAKIDGTLYKDVGFGWGILGHLDKGGRFEVEQGNVGEDGWVTTRMTLNFTGKVLLFKSLAINSTEIFSQFRKVPNTLSFQDGVALLKQREAKPANGTNNAGG